MHRHDWQVIFYNLDWKAYECGCGAGLSLHAGGVLYYSPRIGVWVKRYKK
jgi:hypothetical protein